MTHATRSLNATKKPAATSSREFRTFLLMAQFEAQEIGARLQQARKERGLTQEDLAAIASFSKRSLQDYERGATIPYKHLAEIGRLLGRDTAWFLHGEPEDSPTEVRLDPEQLAELRAQVVADLREALGDELGKQLQERLPQRDEQPARRRASGKRG